MQSLPFMMAALVIGAFLSAQPAMNAVLARALESPFGAAAISHFIALLSILALVAYVGAGEVTRARLADVPWWIYLAGVIGMVFVASGIVIAPVTGTLVFFVCIVAGQMIGSLLADHYGAFGLEVREANPMRVFGIVLVLTGAVLVSRW